MRSILRSALAHQITAHRFSGSSTEAMLFQQWVNGGEEPHKNGLHTRDIKSTVLTLPSGEKLTVNPTDIVYKSRTGKFGVYRNDEYMKMYVSISVHD